MALPSLPELVNSESFKALDTARREKVLREWKADAAQEARNLYGEEAAEAIKELDRLMPDLKGAMGAVQQLGIGLKRAVADQLPEDAARLYRSTVGAGVVLDEDDWASRTIRKQQEDRTEAPMPIQELSGNKRYRALAGGPQSMATSIVTGVGGMLAGGAAGAAAGSAVPGIGNAAGAVVGAAVGSAALSGGTFYAIARDRFLEMVRDHALASNGSLSPADWAGLKKELESEAAEYGLAEAGPEAISQAFSTFLFKSPAAQRVIGKALSQAGMESLANRATQTAIGRISTKYGAEVAEELATETTTQVWQGGIEERAGLRKEAPTVGEAFREVAPEVIGGALIQGGAFDVASRLGRKRQPKDTAQAMPEGASESQDVPEVQEFGAGELMPAEAPVEVAPSDSDATQADSAKRDESIGRVSQMVRERFQPTARASVFLRDFLGRLHDINTEAAQGLTIEVLDGEAFERRTGQGNRAAFYLPSENRLILSQDHEGNQGDGIISTIVHEAGHFAERFGMDSQFVQEQWRRLLDADETAHEQAFQEYLGRELNDDERSELADPTSRLHEVARSEWFALQFARVVRGETQGMDASLQQSLQQWLDVVRELVNRYIGDGRLTTQELDAKILDMLGYQQAQQEQTTQPEGGAVQNENQQRQDQEGQQEQGQEGDVLVPEPESDAVMDSAGAGPQEAPALTGKETTVRTPASPRPVLVRFRLVEEDELLTSQDEGFESRLQPRDRSRRASQEQVARLAAGLEPAMLGDSLTSDSGAPIVDERGQVLSGNGRVLALRAAYSQMPASGQRYRAWLAEQAQGLGLDGAAIERMVQPVLVRELAGLVNKEQFARESNRPIVAGMSEAEQASADGQMLRDNPDLLDLWRPSGGGDVAAASNREFMSRFVATAGEAEAMMLKDGRFSPIAIRRAQNAVLSALVGPANRDAVVGLTEDTEGRRRIANGLRAAANRLTLLLGTDYDLGGHLAMALKEFQRAQEAEQTVDEYLAQQQMFAEAEVTPEAMVLMQMLGRANSAKAIASFLNFYSERALKVDTATGDMFGVANPSRIDLLRESERRAAESSRDAQADLALGAPGEVPGRGQTGQPAGFSAGGFRTDGAGAGREPEADGLGAPPDKERKYARRIREYEGGPEMLRAEFDETRRTYTPVSQQAALDIAAQEVERLGPQEAMRAVMDLRGTDLPDNVRAGMARILVERFAREAEEAKRSGDAGRAKRQHDASVRLADFVAEKLGTERGRGIQMLRGWVHLLPLGWVVEYQRKMDQGVRERMNPEQRREADAVADGLNAAQWEALEALQRDPALMEAAIELARHPEGKQRREVTRDEQEERTLWEQYRQSAANSIISRALASSPPVLQEFTNRLKRSLAEKMERPASVRERVTPREEINEALRNLGRYDEVVRTGIQTARQRQKELGREEKPDLAQIEALEQLVEQLKRARGRPLRPGAVRSVIQDAMRELQIRPKDLIGDGLAQNAPKVVDRIVVGTWTGTEASILESAIREELALLADQAARLAAEQAIRKRQEEASKGAVWGRYSAGASDRLVRALINRFEGAAPKDQPVLQQFTQRLASVLKSEVAKNVPPAPGKAKLSDLDVLIEGIENAEKYQEAWGKAQQLAYEQFKGEPAKLEGLARYFGKILVNPYTGRVIQGVLKTEMQSMQVEMRDIIRQHWMAQDEMRQDLYERIMQRTGASEQTARQVAEAVTKAFDQKAAAARAKALDTLAKNGSRSAKAAKTKAERLGELAALGAFRREDVYHVVAAGLGLPAYDPKVAAEIQRRAEQLLLVPDGFQKDWAVQDLMAFVAKQEGISLKDLGLAFFYANILSGWTTQTLNAMGNMLNMTAEGMVASISTPKAARHYLTGLWHGLYLGAEAGWHILKTGEAVGAKMTKVELPPTLEMLSFGTKDGVFVKNAAVHHLLQQRPAMVLNAWRYVGRFMSAIDQMFYRGAEEARGRLLAAHLAQQEGLAGDDLVARVSEVLHLSPEAREAAKAQAAKEGLKGINAKLRARELLAQQMPAELVEGRVGWARTSTFNQDPQGVMGAVASSIRNFSNRFWPAKLVVPFTNIVANVFNQALNYSPWGYTRLFWGYQGGEGFATEKLEPGTLEHREQLGRATLGTLGLAVLASLSGAADEEDAADDFLITGRGPTDPNKRFQLMETGWRPYSIRLGGIYWSYQESPLVLGMAIVGNYQDAVRYGTTGEQEAMDRTAYAVAQVASTMLDRSFLSSLADFIEVATDGSPEKIERLFARTVTGATMPNLLKQVDRVFDPTVYDAQTLMEYLQRETPIARAGLNPRLNALGQEVHYDLNRWVEEQNDSDPVWNLIVRNRAWIGRYSEQVMIGTRPISPEEHYRYVREAGQSTYRRIEREMSDLQAMQPGAVQRRVRQIASQERERVLAEIEEGAR